MQQLTFPAQRYHMISLSVNSLEKSFGETVVGITLSPKKVQAYRFMQLGASLDYGKNIHRFLRNKSQASSGTMS